MSEITKALRQYEREKETKKAVLLTQGGGYYLCDNRFCTISDFEVDVTGDGLQIQGTSTPCGLFFGMTGDTLRWAVRDTGDIHLDRLSLIFHIALDEEDDVLRGILFARQQKAYLSLFMDPEAERLYRAILAPVKVPMQSPVPQELVEFAEKCARDSIHRLTALYLHGQRLSQLGEVMES